MEKRREKATTKKVMVFVLLLCAIAAFSKPSHSPLPKNKLHPCLVSLHGEGIKF
jgi:hypothetical protein